MTEGEFWERLRSMEGQFEAHPLGAVRHVSLITGVGGPCCPASAVDDHPCRTNNPDDLAWRLGMNTYLLREFAYAADTRLCEMTILRHRNLRLRILGTLGLPMEN